MFHNLLISLLDVLFIFLIFQTYPPVHDNQKLMGCDEEYYNAKQKVKELISEKTSEREFIHVVSTLVIILYFSLKTIFL